MFLWFLIFKKLSKNIIWYWNSILIVLICNINIITHWPYILWTINIAIHLCDIYLISEYIFTCHTFNTKWDRISLNDILSYVNFPWSFHRYLRDMISLKFDVIELVKTLVKIITFKLTGWRIFIIFKKWFKVKGSKFLIFLIHQFNFVFFKGFQWIFAIETSLIKCQSVWKNDLFWMTSDLWWRNMALYFIILYSNDPWELCSYINVLLKCCIEGTGEKL